MSSFFIFSTNISLFMTNFLKLIEHIQQEHKNYLSIYVFVMWIKEHFNYLSKEKNKKKTNKQRYYFGSNNVLVAAKNVACCFYWCLGSHGMGWLFGATYRSKMRRLFHCQRNLTLIYLYMLVVAFVPSPKNIKNSRIVELILPLVRT